MQRMNKTLIFLSVLGICGTGFSQQNDSISLPDTNLEPPDMAVEDSDIKSDSTISFKRIKLDGIAAVIGDLRNFRF